MLRLIFRSLNHFEFIFVYGVRECSNFIDLHVTIHFVHYCINESYCSEGSALKITLSP